MVSLAVHDRPPQGVGSWKVRRRLIWIIVAFCMGIITYAVARDMKGRVAETAVMGSFALLGSVAGCYIFGAAWTDISFAKEQPGHHYGGHYGRGIEETG